MTGKFVFLLALLVSIAAIASGDDTRPRRNLIVGAHTPYDKLVVRESIIKHPSWIFGTPKLEKTFYTLSERSIITQVRALDQAVFGEQTEVSLLGGGPGANNVTIFFKGQMGRDINFIVELWAE